MDGSARDLPLTGRACADLADPFPGDDPLPGAYELHLAAENVTIWYTVIVHESRDVISIQHVSIDT
jgi:hypothetical protein